MVSGLIKGLKAVGGRDNCESFPSKTREKNDKKTKEKEEREKREIQKKKEDKNLGFVQDPK